MSDDDGCRFRKLQGKMMVIAPDNETQVRDVVVVYDRVNDMFGIQLIGQTQLRGYSFFVSQQALKKSRDQGEAVDVLRLG